MITVSKCPFCSSWALVGHRLSRNKHVLPTCTFYPFTVQQLHVESLERLTTNINMMRHLSSRSHVSPVRAHHHTNVVLQKCHSRRNFQSSNPPNCSFGQWNGLNHFVAFTTAAPNRWTFFSLHAGSWVRSVCGAFRFWLKKKLWKGITNRLLKKQIWSYQHITYPNTKWILIILDVITHKVPNDHRLVQKYANTQNAFRYGDV